GIEIFGDEQPLQPAYVVEMDVGDEQRARGFAVVLQVGGQALAAAVDGQPRRTVALDGRHGRPECGRRGVADPLEAQGPHQRRLPRGGETGEGWTAGTATLGPLRP